MTWEVDSEDSKDRIIQRLEIENKLLQEKIECLESFSRIVSRDYHDLVGRYRILTGYMGVDTINCPPPYIPKSEGIRFKPKEYDWNDLYLQIPQKKWHKNDK